MNRPPAKARPDAPGPAILQIVPELSAGGAERATIEIAAALRKAGARALVASQGGRLEAELASAGGELIDFPAGSKNPLRMIANAAALKRIVARENVVLIHARSRAPAWSALVAARSAGIPLVTTYHGAYGEATAIKRAYNSVMVRGEAVIANSQFTARLIQQRYRTPAERISVIPRGVDQSWLEHRTPAKAPLAALRRSWGLADRSCRVILHAARLTGWKGQEVTVEAMRRLRDRGVKDVVCVLAGDDQGRRAYRQRLENLIAAYNLGDMVRLVGHCSDMPTAFAIADLALVPSTEPEAFGRAAVEAQAAGCPVVVSDLGAVRETVLAPPQVEPEKRTGWRVAPGSADALAAAIGEALALSPQKLRGIGTRGRTHVAANFSLALMQRKTLAVYDGLLGTGLAARLAKG